MKDRLDKLLLALGLCETRTQAQGLILSGNVMVENQVQDKPGMLIDTTATITVKARPKYVSRGGLKLEKALNVFQVDVHGKICIDIGASTGGFTDCLLQAGATHVYAVDVGHGQLDWKLRQDERVTVMEKTHIVNMDISVLNPLPTLAVIDVSFISLKKVLPSVVQCMSQDAESLVQILALVKPQFEYRDYCPLKGFEGVVTNPKDHETILMGLATDLATLLPGWQLWNMTESPIQGPKGNHEFFFAFCPHNTHCHTSNSPLSERIKSLLFDIS